MANLADAQHNRSFAGLPIEVERLRRTIREVRPRSLVPGVGLLRSHG
jgi:hypothetical protein